MKVAYIAGPYRGSNAWEVENNIRRAEDTAFQVAQLGWSPLCPHTNTRFFDGTISSGFWLEATMELMRRCDAVVLVQGWGGSMGSVLEIDEARRLGKPVYESPMLLKSHRG